MAKEEDLSVSTLFKEIDEELRQDKVTNLWKQYGSVLIAAIVCVVLGVAAYEGWKSYDLSTRTELSNKYAQALDLARKGDLDGATKSFQALADETDNGYDTLARMQQAGLLVRQNKMNEAATAYFQIAQNNDIDPVFKEMAIVLGALNGLDVMEPQDIIAHLQPLVGSASAWRHSATEITAYAQAKAGNKAKAAELMSSLADDASAPPGVRQRAREFAQAYAG
ncbi:MAG: tetratricopeptide repeat protein [Methylocystaceae bacterium]|nr:tetratricopeptide repeat protein [Methylocystaceae bacterium]